MSTSVVAARPPAQPTAILRGHRAQVHAAVFMRLDRTAAAGATMTADTRLVTGDSDGYVALWDLAIVRTRGVWRAHKNSILGIAAWDDAGQVVTHGRDHRLVVWQVGVADEARLSTVLPLDLEASSTPSSAASSASHPQPWMVHVLDVNTMNFCAFAWCGLVGSVAAVTAATTHATAASMPSTDKQLTPTSTPPTERLVAVPNTLTLEAADIYHLPSQRRINTVRLGTKEGMIMALALFYAPVTDTEATDDSQPTLVLIAAFENGVAVAALLRQGADGPADLVYRAQPHSQPILSLDVAPDRSYFLTSAADAVVAKHPIRVPAAPKKAAAVPASTLPSASPASPPAPPTLAGKPVSLLSAALAKEAAAASPPSPSNAPPTRGAATPLAPVEVETQPLAVINTKHAGQQGLRIRDDGRLFATAGWDARVRVYTAQTMTEVAVLKWHQTGCFAVAFAPVVVADTQREGEDEGKRKGEDERALAPTGGSTALASRHSRRDTSVKERRLRHAVTAHWLAVGSKDGKVSLWDIF
ncbi:WD repeat protein [Sporothrix schenckii 1099-18]|uniref:ASTRA-associated protein 1 n=1 Tax=Sporothrix schenckii 1099-18 TaxID=1397361 RepID=A0A0F2MEC0_SPOSC|nr:WD repeat protein [Sporothrix schenckii 1099-18]KJR87972.1 WD repeat protein [Sporothrix schenckii 1099-18]